MLGEGKWGRQKGGYVNIVKFIGRWGLCPLCKNSRRMSTLQRNADPERGGGGRGQDPPLKNHKNIGFPCNTGPDPL